MCISNNIFRGVIIVGAIIQIFVAAFPGWQCSRDHNYHIAKEPLSAQGSVIVTIFGSQYGPLIVRVNGGDRFSTWRSLLGDVCSLHKSNTFSSETAALGTCGTQCRKHFQDRCSVYNKIAAVGLVAFSLLLLGSVMSLVGTCQRIYSNKPGRSPCILWLLGLLCSAAGISVYFFTFSHSFTVLQKTSQIPTPFPCVGFYIAVVTTTIPGVASILETIMICKRRKLQKNLEQGRQILSEPASYGLPSLPSFARLYGLFSPRA